MNAILLNTEDYPKWDEFVDESPQGSIFCYSWWLKESTNDDFRISAVINNDRIIAGMALPYYQSRNIRHPQITQTLGMLYRNLDDMRYSKKLEREKEYVNQIMDLVDNNIKTFNMYFNHNFTNWLPFYWRGYKQTTRYTYVLDYKDRSVDDLWMNLSKTHRQAIKKTENLGLNCELSDDIGDFYQVNKKTFENQGLKIPYTFDFLRRMDDALKKRNRRTIFRVVDSNGVTNATSYFINDDKSAYYLMSGADPEKKDNGSQILSLWKGIVHYIDKVDLFDFEGSMMEKIENNNRKFGGIQKPYFAIYKEESMDLMKKGLSGILGKIKNK